MVSIISAVCICVQATLLTGARQLSDKQLKLGPGSSRRPPRPRPMATTPLIAGVCCWPECGGCFNNLIRLNFSDFRELNHKMGGMKSTMSEFFRQSQDERHEEFDKHTCESGLLYLCQIFESAGNFSLISPRLPVVWLIFSPAQTGHRAPALGCLNTLNTQPSSRPA